jgi:hypothetical protein
MVLDSSGGEGREAVICLTLTTSKPRLIRPSEISSAGVLSGRWRHRLYGLFGFGEEGIVGQVLSVEVGFDGLKSTIFLVMTLVPFLVLRNSKFSLTTLFSCFCSRISLTADVRTIGGVVDLVWQELLPRVVWPRSW